MELSQESRAAERFVRLTAPSASNPTRQRARRRSLPFRTLTASTPKNNQNQDLFLPAAPGCARGSALEAVGGSGRAAASPTPSAAQGRRHSFRVPTGVPCSPGSSLRAPAFGLRRVYRRFGPCPLPLCGLQLQFAGPWFGGTSPCGGQSDAQRNAGAGEPHSRTERVPTVPGSRICASVWVKSCHVALLRTQHSQSTRLPRFTGRPSQTKSDL